VQSDTNSLTIYPEYILPYLVHALAHNSCPNVEECKDVGAYDNIYRYYITHFRYLYVEDYKLCNIDIGAYCRFTTAPTPTNLLFIKKIKPQNVEYLGTVHC
jgi:hypothetical protein